MEELRGQLGERLSPAMAIPALNGNGAAAFCLLL